MNADPNKTALRIQKKFTRFGDCPEGCVFDGYSDPAALIPKTAKWFKEHGVSVLELEHIFGKNHDPESTVLVCRNCHGEITEDRMQAGIPMRYEPDPYKRLVIVLEAEAVLHDKLATSKRRWAQFLRDGVVKTKRHWKKLLNRGRK